MQLTPRRHELLSTLLLGLGTLFMYLGYHTQSFISEAVIHSVHSQHPERISEYAGYYGQAIHYTAFAISTLFTAALQHYLPSKWILVLATALFAIYHLGFFYINSYFFYVTQILMGLAYSLYNNGEGAYLAEHSSRRTVESNTGLETSVGHTSMFVGGICLISIFYFMPQEAVGHSNSRAFSDVHIKAIYGTFFILSLVAIVIFALLPKKQQADSIASNSPRIIPGVKQQMIQLAKTVIHPNMIMLAFTFFYMGLLVSFMLGIYPTSLSFTSSLKKDVYILGLYSLFVGIAEMSGLLIRPLIKRAGRYKLPVIMGIHVVVVAATLTLINLSVPNTATIRPSSSFGTVLKPSRTIACIVGYLIGMADFTITMGRAVICQIAVPESRGEVFSLTRLFQCISSCIVLFLSPHITLHLWTIILSIGLAIGAIMFIIVAWRSTATTATVADIKSDESRLQASAPSANSIV